jgi:cytochrome c oxidase assembly protein subunit 15
MELTSTQKERRIAIWLLFCAGMIFAMVVLGGVTRLTRSGLSIVVWEPIRGILPPLNRQAWEAEFARYKRSPEYQKINKGMTLEGFKSIYWMEYLHRLWGRLIGMAFFLPFVFFWLRGYLTRRLFWHSWLMFMGGALQGVMGWYMVKSGLVNDPHVSQYRLVAHLSIAFLLYAYLLWIALGLLLSNESPKDEAQTPIARDAWRRLRLASASLLLGIGVMVISGGFVAGLKAGLMYNTFPKMGAHWLPPGLLAKTPWYLNFFESHVTVQFTHRLLAYGLLVAVAFFWWGTRHLAMYRRFQRARIALVMMLGLQISLGIATLLLFVPVSIGTLHQMGALCLFTIALYLHFEVTRMARA